MSPSSVRLMSSRLRRAAAVSAIAGMLCVTAAPLAAQGQRAPESFSVLPTTITGVVVENGALFVTGLIGSNPFRAPLTLGAEQQAGACPILDLQIGEIDLTLLGLNVKTSPICLEVTAFEGGGLLGDLLCAVANLLSGGTPLALVLGTLEAQGNLDRFLDGLTSIIDQVFDRIASTDATPAATCEILSLALGPIDLDLLGLQVRLNDCAEGPVTVDITAIPGGGLLGDLLCSLSNLLGNQRASQRAVRQLLWNITRVLGGLLG